MSTVSNCGTLTERYLMIVLDDENVDILRKMVSVYFNHHIYNEIYLTDTRGICKKTSIYKLDVSCIVWKQIFFILNLAGYYVVHDINYPDLWIIGKREDIVDDQKYKDYINFLDQTMEENGLKKTRGS